MNKRTKGQKIRWTKNADPEKWDLDDMENMDFGLSETIETELRYYLYVWNESLKTGCLIGAFTIIEPALWFVEGQDNISINETGNTMDWLTYTIVDVGEERWVHE